MRKILHKFNWKINRHICLYQLPTAFIHARDVEDVWYRNKPQEAKENKLQMWTSIKRQLFSIYFDWVKFRDLTVTDAPNKCSSNLSCLHFLHLHCMCEIKSASIYNLALTAFSFFRGWRSLPTRDTQHIGNLSQSHMYSVIHCAKWPNIFSPKFAKDDRDPL